MRRRLLLLSAALGFTVAAWMAPAPAQAVVYCTCSCSPANLSCMNPYTGFYTACGRFKFGYCL